jgi:hypothetical protein
MPRESFPRKREKGLENRKTAIGGGAFCNFELSIGRRLPAVALRRRAGRWTFPPSHGSAR